MDRPNYVLKTHEAVLVPVNQGSGLRFLKLGVWIVVAIIVTGSFIFQTNLFSEISWTARVLLIVLTIGVTFLNGKKEYAPSPMELQFYDSYLVLYLPKRYYSPRITRMEINRMNYTDITKCVIEERSRRIHIYGNGISTWYNYKADGSLPKNPTRVRNYTAGMIYFNIRLSTEIDFKTEIEAHSPIKVIVENG